MTAGPKVAMVLAAGLGRRLRPITDTMPNPLLRIAGRALLDRGLDSLAAAGVEKAVVNVHHFPEQIAAHVASRTSPRIVISDESGGLLDSAVDIVSRFVPPGSNAVIIVESGGQQQVKRANPRKYLGLGPNFPVAVLVNNSSASASEIVAGAIKDTERGILVGETTFGKGTVQQWTPLDDDNGGFRLTVAKWLTPDKHWIHQVGIEPDVEVDVDTASGDDPILEAALEALDASEPSAARLAPAA